MNVSAFSIAQRFVGMKEVPGTASNPAILAMLQLDNNWPQNDSVAWCSAWINYICWLLRLPRSKSLSARSWLAIGVPVTTPEVGFDVAVLKRGEGQQPGPEVLDAQGHVGFYAGQAGANHIQLLGGNQGDAVSIQSFPVDRVLGYRRLLT